MKKLKMGTPAMGIVVGLGCVGLAALVMLIGFWKTLLLALLFGIGFFIGTVENKQEFIKNTANKIIPAKDAKVIDIKSEISRDQDDRQSEVPQIQADDKKEDGE